MEDIAGCQWLLKWLINWFNDWRICWLTDWYVRREKSQWESTAVKKKEKKEEDEKKEEEEEEKSEASEVLYVLRLWAAKGAAMLVHTLPTKKRLACDVMYTATTQTKRVDDTADLVKMTALTAVFLRLSTVSFFFCVCFF